MGAIVFERARGYGRRPAIAGPAGTVSYADLDARSARVARDLLGDRADLAEDRVAFFVPPGPDYVVSQWAIWRAGGVAVPLALGHPDPELTYVLGDAAPVAVIANPASAPRIEPLARAVDARFLTSATPSSPPPPGDLPHVDVGGGRRAMIIYTSGTTGKPKGVVTTHATHSARVETLVQAWGWHAGDRILHVLPLHHVHGIVNALSCPLWSGALVEMLPMFEPGAVWERLAAGELTVFMAVPTIYARLIAAWEGADQATRTRWSAGAERLRLMVSGSAALPVRVLERWREITGHVLLERYGMTEIGMALSNPLAGERRPGTVGVPLPGVEVRLTGDDGQVPPEGAEGEIEVRGPQVFLEYWRKPEETRAAFRDGWFRTGDLARVDRGYWRILGRRSVDIIKTAGYKVSALEIEECLREHPAVGDVAVVGVADADLGERVVGAVVTTSGVEPEALLAWARDRLAPYKVPRDLRLVGELPRNVMGKVTKPLVRRLFDPP